MAGRIYKKHQERRRKALRNYRRHTLYIESHYKFESWTEHPYESQQELWEAQERARCEALLEYQKKLPYSQTTCRAGGAKIYKRKYHRMRRRQSQALCYYAFYEDEVRFDQISPEGFCGAIDHDIW